MKNLIIKSATWVADQGTTAWMDRDPRSVHAMLRGNSDGREKRYAKFEHDKRGANPSMTLEEISEQFERHIRDKEDATVSRRPNWLLAQIMKFAVPASGLAGVLIVMSWHLN